MNVLITAPSLDVNKNVSGISAVVNTIIDNNKTNNYIHFLAGRQDGATGILQRFSALTKSYWSLIQILRKQSINLVHLNLPLNPPAIIREYLFFRISKLFGKKVMLHLHGGEYLLHKPSNFLLKSMINFMYKGSENVVCLSDNEKEVIKKAYSLKEVLVLENTVDASYGRLDKPINSDPQLTILFLGRLHESKGIHIILETIEMLVKKGHKNMLFIFCGMGPLLADVIQMEQTYPYHIRYMGVVSGNEKFEMLAKAQVFILPSLYGEGLPMSLLEAMAAGVVPIVTNDGSMSSVVKDNETGLIVEKGNAMALAAQIEKLMDSPESVKRIGRNAKSYAANKFSIEKYIYDLNELYRKSIA